MDEDLKKLLAAVGRALIALAGEEAVPPAVEERPKKKPVWRKFRDMTCVRCGAAFRAKTSLAKYCDGCKAALRKAKMNKFVKNYVREAETHAPMPEPVQEPEPKTERPTPAEEERFDCPRLHVKIAPDFCGSRDECWHGKPCPNTAGKKRSYPAANFKF